VTRSDSDFKSESPTRSPRATGSQPLATLLSLLRACSQSLSSAAHLEMLNLKLLGQLPSGSLAVSGTGTASGRIVI
jgi:hypothetical protein